MAHQLVAHRGHRHGAHHPQEATVHMYHHRAGDLDVREATVKHAENTEPKVEEGAKANSQKAHTNRKAKVKVQANRQKEKVEKVNVLTGTQKVNTTKAKDTGGAATIARGSAEAGPHPRQIPPRASLPRKNNQTNGNLSPRNNEHRMNMLPKTRSSDADYRPHNTVQESSMDSATATAVWPTSIMKHTNG